MYYDSAMTTSDVPSTSQQPDERSFRDVLFVCDHNAGRSQIAQAFFERDAPEDLRAESAGTEPAAAIWPQVVEAMREVGFDLSGRKPKKLTLEMQLHADWAITMGCADACPYVPAMVEAWDIPDPAGRPIEDVRAIRDGIEAHVRELLGDRLEAIRSDRTAHELRLARLLPALVREFADTKPAEEIRACADVVLTGFDGARVRTHVMALAHRQTRECLRRDICDLLAMREPS
jgi:protein-tyrosine-phosphatase